ncbi:AlbA family DNA-binding domain-containing protein [Haloplanus rallus]|nr:ATP-binding protein [Haloplanus rallus]
MSGMVPRIEAEADWSQWRKVVNPDTLTDVPTKPGIYRVSHLRSNAIYLFAKTNSSIRDRVRKLGYALEESEKPDNEPHTAGPALWEIQRDIGDEFIVSWMLLDSHSYEDVIGIWAACLARHHAITGRSPIANFGSTANINGKYSDLNNDQSVNSGSDQEYREVDYNKITWENWDDVTSDNWMGLPWSEGFNPSDIHNDPFPRKPGVFRVRSEDSSILSYIGAVRNIHQKVQSDQENFPPDPKISFFEFNIAPTSKKNEIQAILMGANYLAGKPLPDSDYEGISFVNKAARDLIDRSEDELVELKQEPLDHQSFTQEMVAIANAGGGEIFVGISDNVDPIGVEDIEDLESQIRNWATDTINPSMRIKTRRPTIDGETILWVRVPPAERAMYNAGGVFRHRHASEKDALHWRDLEKFLVDNPDVLLRIIQSSDVSLQDVE